MLRALKWLAVFAMALPIPECLPAATAFGALQGTVVDNAGKPVVRAQVLLAQAPPASAPKGAAPPVITGPQMGITMSDYQGHFISYLPAGNYVACAQPSSPGLLDPCHWASAAPTFSITAGKATSGVTIALTAGAVLSIRVNDPNQLLVPAKHGVEPDCRVQIVTANGYRYEAAIQSSDSSGRNHAFTVPFGTAVSVQIVSPKLAVNDSAGHAVSAAGTSATIPSSGSPAQLSYTVAGSK